MLMEVFKVIQREVEQGGFIVIIWVFYHGGVQAVGKIVNTPLESEMQAILMAIQHAWSRGFSKLCIESDSKKVVDILNGKILHFDSYNWKREILWWNNRLEGVIFQWIGREGNRVADKLVKHQMEDNVYFKFYFYVPRFLSNELHYDYVCLT